MRRRLLELGLLAYPRAVRELDGDHLRDLALELADDHGTGRELLGLVRGGLGERRRRMSRARSAMAAVGATLALALGIVAWSAATAGAQVEEDRFACVGECAETRAEVADRVEDGWTCTSHRQPTEVQWRCSD